MNQEYKNIIAVTNRHLCSRPLPEQIRKICELSPKGIILREKDMSENEYKKLAEEVLSICEEYHVPCMLHTYINTAKELNHPAIHLPLPLLRKYQNELSFFSTIGTSIHSASEVLEAEHLGASYVTAGHIYTTDCKKGLEPRGLGFLCEVTGLARIPVYAIGGIQPGSGQIEEVMRHGADGGCIMSGMMHV